MGEVPGNQPEEAKRRDWSRVEVGGLDIDAIEMDRLATLLVSQGVPMIVAGDECRRTQHGNNNAYCQDNEISWFDWSLVNDNQDLVRFVRTLIEFFWKL